MRRTNATRKRLLFGLVASSSATGALALILAFGSFTSQATQTPTISLDMDGRTNTYVPSVDNNFDGLPDAGSNVMTVGTTENCFTEGTGIATAHPIGAPAAGYPPFQFVIKTVMHGIG